MIKSLIQQHNESVKALDAEIQEVQDSVDSFAIVEDPNFALKRNGSELTLTGLNESINVLDADLSTLNDLWVIKGLIQETETFLNPTDFLMSLEIVYDHLSKLGSKLEQLNKSDFIIRYEIKAKYEELIDRSLKELRNSFNEYVPSSNEFNSVLQGVSFSEFIKLTDQFSNIEDNINLNELINEHKQVWESFLLGILYKRMTLVSEGDKHLLNIDDITGDILEGKIESIFAFIKFLNLFGLASIKSYFQLKLSNTLIDLVSQNISSIVKNKDIEKSLIDLIEFSNNNDWHLSINLTTQNFNSELNAIYDNWVVQIFIDKIRKKFDNFDFKNLNEVKWQLDQSRLDTIEKSLSDMEEKIDRARSNDDEWDGDWDEGWGKEQPQKEEPKDEPKEEPDDGWDDGWNEEWDEPKKEESVKEQPKAQSKPVPTLSGASTTTIKISNLPNEIIEIINDFQIESTQDHKVLISTILALSSVSYPPSSISFLKYNDLQYISRNLGQVASIDKYTENIIRIEKNALSKQLFEILVKLRPDTGNDKAVRLLEDHFDSLFDSQLKNTNFIKFKEFLAFSIEFSVNWINNMALSTSEITELVSESLTTLISKFETLVRERLLVINEVPENYESLKKLENFKFLINNHLVDIIGRFYQGELYNLKTDEIVQLINSCFVKSELRDNYIEEIIEFRRIA